MHAAMASVAECNEVVLGIVASETSELEMVHLESAHASAVLTPPSVTLEHFSMQLPVCALIKSPTTFPWRSFAHDATATCSKKARFWVAERNL